MSVENHKKKARCYDNLHTFIYRLLKHYNPQANITAECKDILNNLIINLGVRYVSSSVELCRYANKITIDSNTIETLAKIWIQNPNRYIDFARSKWDVYSLNTKKGVKKNTRAGLFLPPARFHELFKKYRGADQKIGETAYVFLTAIIEATFGHVIENALVLAKAEGKLTVSGIHIYRSINSSELNDLKPLFKDTFIAGFGYLADNLLITFQQNYLCKK